MGIKYQRIRPYTPCHNGKVERDSEWFYRERTFYSLADLAARLVRWKREYNNLSMKLLNWNSPKKCFSLFSLPQQFFYNICLTNLHVTLRIYAQQLDTVRLHGLVVFCMLKAMI
ncbi:integrase core domain-containing protein [Colibacter massiliensis]|uniref:integrase core domain-containing protein n=1 Tax=Colibacter massiliensis TaxID=1852379 RepID=UPI003F8F4709